MKLRCFARCERRGECRGAVKGSAALQFRSTTIDRSREPLLKCELSMLQTGGSAPLPGRGLYAHSRNRPCGLPVRISDSVCELVGTHAGCLRRPGRFAPEPQTGRVPVPTAALPPCNSGQLRLTGAADIIRMRTLDATTRRLGALARPGSGPFGPGGIPKAAKAFGGV